MGSSCLKEIYQSFVINIHLFVMVIMVDLLAKKQNMILFQMECYPKVEILGDTFEPFDIWLAHQIRIGAWPHVTSQPWHSPPPASCCSAKITKSVCDAFGRGGTVDGNLALFMDQRCWHYILCIWARIYILHYSSIDIYILLYHYIHICQLDIVKYSTDGKDFKHICPDRQISLTGGYRYPRNCTVR